MNPVRSVLLFLLAVFIAFPTPDAATAKPAQPAYLTRFQKTVDAYKAKDLQAMPAAGGTVFVGSSTFTKWTSLEKEREFSFLKPINRGFGGSTLPEVNYYFKELVAKYKPAKVVVYAGTNDIADGQSGKDVFNSLREFLKLAHQALPEAQVYFISMSVAPCRLHLSAKYDEGNRLIKALATEDKRFHYIDVVPVMRDERGQLRRDYFGLDNLHMNRKGYEAWIPVLAKNLQ